MNQIHYTQNCSITFNRKSTQNKRSKHLKTTTMLIYILFVPTNHLTFYAACCMVKSTSFINTTLSRPVISATAPLYVITFLGHEKEWFEKPFCMATILTLGNYEHKKRPNLAK